MVNAGPAGSVTRSVTTVLASNVLTLTIAYGRSVFTKVVVGSTGVRSPCPKSALDFMPFAITTLASWFGGRFGAGVVVEGPCAAAGAGGADPPMASANPTPTTRMVL